MVLRKAVLSADHELMSAGALIYLAPVVVFVGVGKRSEAKLHGTLHIHDAGAVSCLDRMIFARQCRGAK